MSRASGSPDLQAPSVAVATRALFLGLALLMAGNGLQGSLVGIRSEAEGFSLAVSGLIMAAYFAGFFAGSAFAAKALGSVGHIRVFAALASTASSAVLVHSVFVTPLVWVAMRFIFGLCMAGLYVVVESWLNELASNETRGRLLSVYMFISLGGLGLGQLLLNVADSNGFVLFVVASVLVSLALVPISLSGTSAPPLTVAEPMSLRELARLVPTGVVASFAVGAASGILLGIGPIYGATVGLTDGQVALFMTAPMVGGLVFQAPIGWLSDRISRRPIILNVAVSGIAVGIVATRLDAFGAQVAAMFVLGGVFFPLYSLALAYTNDWLTPAQIQGASGTMVRVNGMGAVAGPLVTAAAMARFSPSSFYLAMALSCGAIAIFVGYRVLVTEAIPTERQRRFVVLPARSTSVVAQFVPRVKRKRGAPTASRRSFFSGNDDDGNDGDDTENHDTHNHDLPDGDGDGDSQPGDTKAVVSLQGDRGAGGRSASGKGSRRRLQRSTAPGHQQRAD